VQFYYAEGDQQKGPLPIEQLRAAGVRSESLVWHEGMAEWTRADRVPELAVLFAAAPAGVEAAYAAAGQRAAPPAAAPSFGAPPPPQQSPYGPPPGAYAPQPFGGQLGYGAPGAPVVGVPGHGMSVASMILGIISLPAALLAICLFWLAVPLALTAIILGHVGFSAHKKSTGRGSGMAVAGFVCGYIALAIMIIYWATFASIMSTASQKVQQQNQQRLQQMQQQQQQMQKQQSQQPPTWSPPPAPRKRTNW
jgi:hypothetical protein